MEPVLIIIRAFSYERPVISTIIRHANNSSIFPSLGLGRKEEKWRRSMAVAETIKPFSSRKLLAACVRMVKEGGPPRQHTCPSDVRLHRAALSGVRSPLSGQQLQPLLKTHDACLSKTDCDDGKDERWSELRVHSRRQCHFLFLSTTYGWPNHIAHILLLTSLLYLFTKTVQLCAWCCSISN